MVEKLKKILAEIEVQRGPVSLFAILKMDAVVDKWVLVIGSEWIDDSNTKEVFETVRVSLLSKLSQEERATIARISVFNTTEHLIQELSTYKTGSDLSDKTQINGNLIYEGFIIKSA